MLRVTAASVLNRSVPRFTSNNIPNALNLVNRMYAQNLKWFSEELTERPIEGTHIERKSNT